MNAPLSKFPLEDADRCVKCALCLPHCPTYLETRDEGESPRGRIALMQGFATGALEITPNLADHLDRCLTCRACERVCPAEVPYGRLIDAARAQLERSGQGEAWAARAFAAILRHRRTTRWLGRSLWLYQKSGFGKLVKRLPLMRLRRLEALVPALSAPWRPASFYPASGRSRGAVGLFLGCIAAVLDQDTAQAAIRVLTRRGYDVYAPRAQNCCGAIDLHAGRADRAETLARQNLSAFEDPALEAVISTASGCAATLVEYPEVVRQNYAHAFAAKVTDISAFLHAVDWPGELELKPLPVRALLHTPCTLRNVMRKAHAPGWLLARIPELEVIPLPATQGCCGAAGSYLVTQPRMADRLVAHTVEAVRRVQPDVIVTSNIGCMLHLRAALKATGLNIPVKHPIVVFAEQLA